MLGILHMPTLQTTRIIFLIVWNIVPASNLNYFLPSMKKNIVAIGGGNGTAVSVQACKTFLDQINLSAVVSMSDSGGANGKLREETGFLPASDLMRTTLAFSHQDPWILKQIFYKNRIAGIAPEVDGYYIGILWYTLLQQKGLSFMQAQESIEQIVGAVGHVYPATLDMADFCVRLENGQTQKTEGVIDRPTDRSSRITKAWLEPQATLFDGAKKAIEDADVILFGPGSLYCSIVSALLADGTQDAIAKSNATLIYVVGNAYEIVGQAGPEKLSEFITELEQYLPRPLDMIVYNNHELTDKTKKRYEEKEWSLIEHDTTDARVTIGDYERAGGGLDPEKLGALLKDIIL